jgi:4a-hydroxytetrahydrobiopterin dehydratase
MSWKELDNYLVKEFICTDFSSAVAFIDKIVPVADDMNHHPDILIHKSKNVKIMLTTHSAGDNITDKDRELATKIDSLQQSVLF